jgi:hypothetical protein
MKTIFTTPARNANFVRTNILNNIHQPHLLNGRPLNQCRFVHPIKSPNSLLCGRSGKGKAREKKKAQTSQNQCQFHGDSP